MLQPLNQSVPVIGRLISLREAKVPAAVQGKIDKIFVEVGDKVKKKQVLAIIDLNLYKWLAEKASAGVEAAKAKLKNSQALTNLNKLELRRLEKLKDLPSFEVEAAQASLDNAKAITKLNGLELKRLENLKSSPAFNVSRFEDLKSKMIALKANEALAKANLNIALQNEKLANHKAKYEDLQNKIAALLANEEIAKANLNSSLQDEKVSMQNLDRAEVKASFDGKLKVEKLNWGRQLD